MVAACNRWTDGQTDGAAYTEVMCNLPPTKEEVYVFAARPRFCLSVCLSVCKILKNASMDLDEMLRVDKYRDMGERINF